MVQLAGIKWSLFEHMCVCVCVCVRNLEQTSGVLVFSDQH